MKRLVTIEAIERARINAMRDHPKVRRIEGDLYGVTCSKRCVRGSEHQIRFELEGEELWAECIECESERWKRSEFDLCRHVGAALGLYFYYRELEQAA